MDIYGETAAFLDSEEGIYSDYLQHYGVGHDKGGHSGRFPWGSGDNPYQHSVEWIARYKKYVDSGMSEADIAVELFGRNRLGQPNTTKLRSAIAYHNGELKEYNKKRALKLRDDGYSWREIEKAIDIPEATIRGWAKSKASIETKSAAKATAAVLKEEIDKKGIIDIGEGTGRFLGVSDTKIQEAAYILETQGYVRLGSRVPQPTNSSRQTTLMLIGPPGTDKKKAYDYGDIHQIDAIDKYTSDGGRTWEKFQYPASMDSKRLAIRYRDEGGLQQDGLIEIRRGVPDLNLGKGVHYSQVRILVDGDKYLKGMAVYADDLPEGCDVRFNSNKPVGTPLNKVLKTTDKNLQKDPNNPFGSAIKARGGQSMWEDADGKKHLSLINKRANEGDWDEWGKAFPSQFLSKQPLSLINRQLEETKSRSDARFQEIMSLTNGSIKKELLLSFAGTCDSDAVSLKAASLPRSRYQVILPLPDIPANQIYAPNFKHGEKVAIVRFPHESTSQIPILTVNNKILSGIKRITPEGKDAVGISHEVAARMSGADFDGDTVMVIPTNSRVSIRNRNEIKELRNFDPDKYEGVEREVNGVKRYYRNGVEFNHMKKSRIQNEMGQISNLITDMTLRGAPDEHVARAIRHSMVVIDAYKHDYDYQASAKDNDISELKNLYQRSVKEDGSIKTGGASTLISRAKSVEYVTKRKGSGTIDRQTGELIYKEEHELYTDKNGKTKERQQRSTKMAEAKDARKLISSYNTPQERAYAEYANYKKALANKARLAATKTEERKYDKAAALKYKEEVKSMQVKLLKSQMNQPKERQAILLANSKLKLILDENPALDKKSEEYKKIANRIQRESREAVGAARNPIDITANEWNAIQAGAFHPTTVHQIIRFAGTDQVAKLAAPKDIVRLTDAQKARIKSMRNGGRTTADIAQALGVSTSTIWRTVSEEG